MASSRSAASSSRVAAAGPGRWGSPERTMVWTNKVAGSRRKVAVVYYLCDRNGQLDHPHFMEVPLSFPDASLYLRDFTRRLDTLRGNGMASIYAWSSKRSYRNGFVWHDLTEDDLIHPAHANEYVLKGSQLLLLPHQSTPAPTDTNNRATRPGHRKNWSSFDLAADYRVVSLPPRGAADPSTEVPIDEISPPPSSSSPDTIETPISKDVRVPGPRCSREVGVIAGGRMRASAALMQLISCGSITVKDRYHSSGRMGSNNNQEEEEVVVGSDSSAGNQCLSSAGGMERDYFSGSLIETKKSTAERDRGIGALKRSSSYNADRSVKLELGANSREVDGGVRAKCIPRKPTNY